MRLAGVGKATKGDETRVKEPTWSYVGLCEKEEMECEREVGEEKGGARKNE